MAIQGIGGAGLSGINGAGAAPKVGGEKFSQVFKGQTPAKAAAPRPEAQPLAAQSPSHAQAQPRVEAGKSHLQAPQRTAHVEPAKLIDHVAAAQKRMDAVLELAQSGKSFTPAELLSLQSQMYRASQELDLAGKVVEKATAGVKQILQTQV
jgi:hypothetical protein